MIKVGIAGIGLIGASLSLAFKKFRQDLLVSGYDISRDITDKALASGVIDSAEYTLFNLVKSSDIIILSSPISSIIGHIDDLHTVNKTIIVTDTGSVKERVCEHALSLPGNVSFTGGHPMAGSEKGGFEYATADLFVGAPYILCNPTTGKIPDILKELIDSIGARMVILDPQLHDEAVSLVSHLPQLMALSILSLLSKSPADTVKNALQVAGGGFSDLTRIGESPFSVWRDILSLNRRNLIELLDRLIGELETFRQLLREEKIEEFDEVFSEAKRRREEIRRIQGGNSSNTH